MKSPLWTKTEYIKNRVEYWRMQGLPKRHAVDLAEDDWQRYCEKYGFDAE